VNYIIRPEIFDGTVEAFFTGREPGIEVGELIGEATLYMPRQEHTGNVVVLGQEAFGQAAAGVATADAAITDVKGAFLGVQVADCVPILLCDRRGGVFGAVHAGWRGTAKGIIKEAIRAIKDGFGSDPADLRIAIGPAIRWCCYEVGAEVLEAVAAETGEGDYHMEREGKLCLDLPSANRIQALGEGVRGDNLWMSAECTYCYPDKFYSYRYYSKRPGEAAGRQGGFIGRH
jgi:YfiH family protein